MIKIVSKIQSRMRIFKVYVEEFLLDKLINKKNKFIVRVISFVFLFLIQEDHRFVGSLWLKPSFASWILASFGLSQNINSLGNSYSNTTSRFDVVPNIEKEIVNWNKKSLHCQNKNIEGYVTSGGTESNLFLMWAGREYLQEKNNCDPIILFTEFTHYSIKKSSRILAIKSVTVEMNKNSWSVDPNSLETKIKQLYLSGSKTILFPITVGYSSLGTSDSIIEVTNVIERLKFNYKNLNVFVWVDAAAQGIVKSFLDRDFKPFNNDLIQGYVIDFHKLGKAPLPAGMVLYRSGLRKLVETQINYLHESDATMSGSRPGSSILAIWASINSHSNKYWVNHFRKLESKKKKFINEVVSKFPNANVIHDKNSLTIAIIIDNDFPKMSKQLEKKYGLIECNVGSLRHYKIHIIK